MTVVEERPAWLATVEELEQVTPVPPALPIRRRRWVKAFTWVAESAQRSSELPPVMRLWFAAMERCDSEGRADFESGELEDILHCSGAAVRRAIVKAKRGGLTQVDSSARHIYLIGVKDDRPSGKRLAKRRKIDAIGHRYSTSRL